jgi:hypothetical protein
MAGEVDLDGGSEETGVKRSRHRSTIEFPYSDIVPAAGLVRVLHERGGGNASPKQLASWMDQSPTSGTFRSRLSAARIFGFVETERNGVNITVLGRDAIDPNFMDAAFVSAFLNVPLFTRLFEKHEGYPLPPPAALENQIIDLGVSPKQAERARQTFIASATAAGFVDNQSGRIAKPKVVDRGHAPVEPEESPSERQRPVGLHPFIEGLLDTLPPQDSFADWTIEDQAEWLSAAVGIFKLLSKARGRITVSVISDKTTATDQ